MPEARPTYRQQQAQMTKDRIVEAARRLMGERGTVRTARTSCPARPRDHAVHDARGRAAQRDGSAG